MSVTCEVELLAGDCVEVMRTLEAGSVDAICTDPPYGLEFMGKEWDRPWAVGPEQSVGYAGRDDLSLPSHRDARNANCRRCRGRARGANRCRCETPDWDRHPREDMLAFQAWTADWAVEALRVLKPGGHLLAFGGTRTYHRLAAGLEDAGFEIRDTLAWMYGSGFPKSYSVHKATLAAVESRYGTARCDCVDERDGRADRDGLGREDRREARPPGGQGKVSEAPARATDLPLDARASDAALRELREEDAATSEAPAEVEGALLFEDVRGRRPEAARLGDAPLRAGLEEHEGEDPAARPGLSVLREDAEGERAKADCSSRQAVSVRRDEQPEQPPSSMRLLPSHDRGDNDERPRLDSDRRDPRRLVADDHGGRRAALARTCSWCGLPDPLWLSSLEPLGTALKPAFEPVVVARKPLLGTVAANVLEHGTGALNVDACRVAFVSDEDEDESKEKNRHGDFGTEQGGNEVYGDFSMLAARENYDPPGRWPANVLLGHSEDCVRAGTRRVRGNPGGTPQPVKTSRGVKGGSFGNSEALRPGGHEKSEAIRPSHADEDGLEEVEVWKCVADCPVRLLDEQTGDLPAGVASGRSRGFGSEYVGATEPSGWDGPPMGYRDAGGASRFFYCAKTSRAERSAGLGPDFEERMLRWSSGAESPGTFQAEGTERNARNHHPTVKPIALMRWLLRLVTPPGGTVLDPFVGSGSTGCAAVLEPCVGRFVGVERDPGYLRIAEARVAFWRDHGEAALDVVRAREQGERRRQEVEDAGQLDLFAP